MADEMYPEAAPEKETVREDGVETTLVPKSMFPKCQVGETIRMKVVAALEDELEVEATKSEESDREEKRDDEDSMESRLSSEITE